MRAAVVLPTDLLTQQFIPAPAIRALRMVEVLRANAADVHMIEWMRWDNGLPSREVQGAVHYTRFTMKPPRRGLVRRAVFLRKLIRTIRTSLVELRPDGIVVTDEEMLWAGVQARRALGVPLLYDSPEHWTGMVARQRPFEAMLYAGLERLAAPHIEHVYTASAGIARHWQALGCAATVIYNSRDLAEIAPHEIPKPVARRRLGLSDESFVLGYTGSVSPEQGLETSIAALAALPPHVFLVVLGGPSDALRGLESVAARRGVAHRFRALDAVPPAEAVRIQCAFDVGLVTVDGSGPNFDFRLPNKLFDYMALGLPVVVSDYPTLRQLVIDEVGFGVAARPGVPASVEAAVSRLMGDKAVRARMSDHARTAFERTYCGERQKERLRATHAFWRA